LDKWYCYSGGGFGGVGQVLVMLVWGFEVEGLVGAVVVVVVQLHIGTDTLSAVTQSAPPMVTLMRLKVHHLWM
jgi:hypothetical protein